MTESEWAHALGADDSADDGRSNDEGAAPATSLPLFATAAAPLPPAISEPHTGDEEWRTGEHPGSGSSSRTWRHDLPRWLASLNPGRTQREYEKAVGYFFETPGVPAELGALTFDLLLAYRGALALRAAAERDRGSLRRAHPPATSLASLSGDGTTALPIGSEVEDAPWPTAGSATGPSQGEPPPNAVRPPTPLAPATVNIRLTALRQFLCYCSLVGSLPQLTPDRIRAALRRLSIERRRPYQILAEPEWEQFLQAARAPLAHLTGDPWGTPRATRSAFRDAQTPTTDSTSRLARSRSGLTGARTAQRDHALVALALATGLRAVELSGLDVGDLSREWHGGREEWWLVLPDAKTKGQRGGRTLPLAPTLVETLHAYLRATGRSWERAADRQMPLFLSAGLRRGHPPTATTTPLGGKPASDNPRAARPDGQAEHRSYRRLTPNDIGRIVDRIEAQWLAMRGEDAGDELTVGDGLRGDTRLISPHALRHSTAVALLEGNATTGRAPASVEHVRGWLGHFDIRTTQGYLAHLEARKHRRPFTLSPVNEPPLIKKEEDNPAPPAD